MQLHSSKSIDPAFVRIVPWLVTLPIVIVLFGLAIALLVGLTIRIPGALGLAVVLGIGLIATFLHRSIRRYLSTHWREIVLRTVAEPTVFISNDALRVGDAFTLTYSQPMVEAVNVRRFVVQLIRRTRTTSHREFAGYADNQERKHDRVIETISRSGRRFNPGEIFRIEIAFKIPDGAMPSAEAGNKHEEWLVRAHLDVAGKLDFKDEYVIQVLPQPGIGTPFPSGVQIQSHRG